MTWIAVGIAGASLVSGVLGGKKASKAAKRQQQQEAVATNEKIRRLEVEKDVISGRQKTGAAAAGVDIQSKSVLQIQRETIDEIEREKKFVRQAGAFAAESADLRGRAVAYQQYQTALTGAGQIFSLVQANRASKAPTSV